MSIVNLVDDSILRIKNGPLGAPPGPGSSGNINDVLAGLAKYIPTEVVSIFLLALAFESTTTLQEPIWMTVKKLYFMLIVFTPLFFSLVFVVRFQQQNASRQWPRFAQFPLGRCIAATIAFAVWAVAIPKSGIVGDAWAPWLGVSALLVSSVLGLVVP